MSLMVVLLGIGAASYAAGYEARVLRRAASYIESMGSRGHAMSVLHQKPFWLEVSAGRVALVGADTSRQPANEEEFMPTWEELGREAERSHVTVYDEYVSDVEVAIRRWGAAENAWIVPEEKEVVTWQFQSTGLCEPLSIRFAYEGNWIILTMHPLTARSVEEESHIE